MNIISNIKNKIIPEVQQTTYLVGSDLLGNLHNIEIIKKKNYDTFLLFSDKSVFKLYGKSVSHSLKKLNKPVIVSLIPAGEQSKDFKLLAKIIKPYFQNGFTRNSCFISLGGGVVTDIGGFIAAILLRGIPNINIPTTLLGQIDAAIGGKSGVNFWLSKNLMYKNMIGNIKQPKLVISDVEVLKTLPEKEILNGLGEIVKYWVGWGKPNLRHLGRCANALSCKELLRGGGISKKAIKTPPRWQAERSEVMTPRMVEELIKTISICQKIKIDIVKQDPYEKLGIRQKLNLGHTIGHAIEGASKGNLSHGEAVSLGLIAAAKISLMLKLLNYKNYKLITSTINKLGLPTTVSGIDIDMVEKALEMDKKGGKFVLIAGIGKLEVGVKVEKELINKILRKIII
ncbi:3-dehydroquinate synthase [Candidatus Gottesmanbacteria bacterium]|nr:3-dehydroquinate synthase [Candidatus Gottesmanbacteria bacterium]